jgi:hypothetical protein
MAVLDVCKMPQFPYFYPYTNVIVSITNSNPAIITTVNPHGYKSLLIVRIDVPRADGMQQINQLTGTITVTSPTTFTIPIDTTHFTPFTVPEDPFNPGYPPPNTQVCAFVVPIGEDNSIVYQATNNVLPFP